VELADVVGQGVVADVARKLRPVRTDDAEVIVVRLANLLVRQPLAAAA
jgi:hypothetical protein